MTAIWSYDVIQVDFRRESGQVQVKYGNIFIKKHVSDSEFRQDTNCVYNVFDVLN